MIPGFTGKPWSISSLFQSHYNKSISMHLLFRHFKYVQHLWVPVVFVAILIIISNITTETPYRPYHVGGKGGKKGPAWPVKLAQLERLATPTVDSYLAVLSTHLRQNMSSSWGKKMVQILGLLGYFPLVQAAGQTTVRQYVLCFQNFVCIHCFLWSKQ